MGANTSKTVATTSKDEKHKVQKVNIEAPMPAIETQVHVEEIQQEPEQAKPIYQEATLPQFVELGTCTFALDTILCISKFLNFQALCSMAQASKLMYSIFSHELVWRPQFELYQYDTKNKPAHMSWMHYFGASVMPFRVKLQMYTSRKFI